jgi:fatty-acyl-CoA synthase
VRLDRTFGRSAELSGGLAALGVGRADRVAVWLPNGPEWLELVFALSRLGAAAVAINTRFRSHEVQDILVRSGARVLVYAPGFKGIDFAGILAGVDAPALEHVIELPYDALLREPADDVGRDDDPAVIFTSSGTTGAPKLVVHTQHGLAAHADAVASSFGYREDGAVVGAFLPLCGVFGFCTALGALAGGARLIFAQAFDGAAELIERERITHTNLSDEMLRRLLETPERLRTLREAGFAAFNLEPRPLIDAAPFTAYQCYGASEMQALVAHAPAAAPPEARAIAGGRPVSEDIEVRIADGEIQVRGPNVMAGYLGDEQATRAAFTEDGFLRSGDLGHETELGFAYETRRAEALRLAGFLVSPREIEAFLEGCEGVEAAQVVAAGARAVAFALGDFDADAVLARCRAELAAFKVPERIVALDAFPMTDSANGRRVRREELRERARKFTT